MASELADVDETARLDLVRAFDHWQGHLLRGLTRMRDRRELRADADPDALATAIMAGLQGGFLLSQTMRSARPLAIALDAALTYVRSHLAPETRSSGLQTRDSERSR
ncbi:TetR family transcriptional regulator C-terminal domain-containing protein [Streptosporangium lutulentum]